MTQLLIKLTSNPLLAWAPGIWEMVIVLAVVMLLFGNRLPSTMRSLGQSLVQFKKGMRDGEDDEANDKLK